MKRQHNTRHVPNVIIKSPRYQYQYQYQHDPIPPPPMPMPDLSQPSQPRTLSQDCILTLQYILKKIIEARRLALHMNGGKLSQFEIDLIAQAYIVKSHLVFAEKHPEFVTLTRNNIKFVSDWPLV